MCSQLPVSICNLYVLNQLPQKEQLYFNAAVAVIKISRISYKYLYSVAHGCSTENVFSLSAFSLSCRTHQHLEFWSLVESQGLLYHQQLTGFSCNAMMCNLIFSKVHQHGPSEPFYWLQWSFLSLLFCCFLYPYHLFSTPSSTFLYTPFIFIYLSYSTTIRACSLPSSYIHPVGL